MVLQKPAPSLAARMEILGACGPISGPIFICIALLAHLWLDFLEYLLPAADIDRCPPKTDIVQYI